MSSAMSGQSRSMSSSGRTARLRSPIRTTIAGPGSRGSVSGRTGRRIHPGPSPRRPGRSAAPRPCALHGRGEPARHHVRQVAKLVEAPVVPPERLHALLRRHRGVLVDLGVEVRTGRLRVDAYLQVERREEPVDSPGGRCRAPALHAGDPLLAGPGAQGELPLGQAAAGALALQQLTNAERQRPPPIRLVVHAFMLSRHGLAPPVRWIALWTTDPGTCSRSQRTPGQASTRPRRRARGTGTVPWRERDGAKRNRRRLFVTTNRLDSAIAAAATIGVTRPAAASGSAATL